MRSLSPEESALWARVTSTIRPLSRETPATKPVPPPIEATGKAEPKPQFSRPIPVPSSIGRGPGTTLDGGWDRRLRSGAVEPDRVLDLHGKDLDGAWRAIDRSLEHAIACKERVLLLITGHRREGEPPVRRGAIRAAIHDWLAVSSHARHIAAVRGAHRRHGGGGSLYIVLRRQDRQR